MITYELAILIGLIILLIYALFALLLKTNPKKIITICIFIAYLTVVATITLFPILIDEKIEYFGDITWYNIIPFRTITGILQNGLDITSIIQILGNILIAVPYGVFVLLLLQNPNWWKMLLLAFAFTASIELSQLTIGLLIDNMYRNVDIDDIILNMLGVYFGYLIYKVLPKRIKRPQ